MEIVSQKLKDIALGTLEKGGPGVDSLKAPEKTTWAKLTPVDEIAEATNKFIASAPERAGNAVQMGHKIGAGLMDMVYGGAAKAVEKSSYGFTPTKEEQVDLLTSIPMPQSKLLGTGLAGIVATRSRKAGMPEGLKTKLGEIASKEKFKKRSELINHPENYWVDPDTDVTYSLGERGVMFAVPAKNMASHSEWVKKAAETQIGKKLSNDEWKAIKPKFEKILSKEGGLRGMMDYDTGTIHVLTDQPLPKIHSTVAHEASHYSEGRLMQGVIDDGMNSPDINVTPMLGANVRDEFEKLLRPKMKDASDPSIILDEYNKAFDKFQGLYDDKYRKGIVEEITDKIPNEEDRTLYKLLFFGKGNHQTTIKQLSKEEYGKDVLGEELIEVSDSLYDKAFDIYESNPGEVWARRAGNLAEESKETGSFENYRQNLNLISD